MELVRDACAWPPEASPSAYFPQLRAMGDQEPPSAPYGARGAIAAIWCSWCHGRHMGAMVPPLPYGARGATAATWCSWCHDLHVVTAELGSEVCAGASCVGKRAVLPAAGIVATRSRRR